MRTYNPQRRRGCGLICIRTGTRRRLNGPGLQIGFRVSIVVTVSCGGSRLPPTPSHRKDLIRFIKEHVNESCHPIACIFGREWGLRPNGNFHLHSNVILDLIAWSSFSTAVSTAGTKPSKLNFPRCHAIHTRLLMLM